MASLTRKSACIVCAATATAREAAPAPGGAAASSAGAAAAAAGRLVAAIAAAKAARTCGDACGADSVAGTVFAADARLQRPAGGELRHQERSLQRNRHPAPQGAG